MEDETFSIGIDSEIKHVKSETDRIDALFTVPTGPVGHQEINYHIFDEAMNQHINRISSPDIESLYEFSKLKSSIKSSLSSLLYRRAIKFIDTEILNIFPKSSLSTKEEPIKSFDDRDSKPRFSLPEIDSSNLPEEKYQIKKVRKLFKPVQQEQSIPAFNEEKQESSSFFNESTLQIPEHCRPNINNTLQNQAESLLPFYTFNELAQHNDSTDAWICIFDQIYDITSLIKQVQGTSLYQQLIDHAGQDISSSFDEQTHEPRQCIDPQTKQRAFSIKNLSILEQLNLPFWKTNDFFIGKLTKHSRYIRLIHDFAPKQSYLLEVAEEETIGQIARKFLKYNSHIYSYLWRYNGQILDYNKTLTENGIVDDDLFNNQANLQIDNEYYPTILLYFSDDLTIA